MKRVVRYYSLLERWGAYLAKRHDGWVCHYCKIALTDSRHKKAKGKAIATIDHKEPKSKGGSDEPKNLVLSCAKCNQEKGDTDYETFKRMKEK